MSHKESIEKLWTLISEQKWTESKALFHKEFSAYWPQSKEKFIGADNFIGMNAEYPGNHIAKIKHIVECGDTVSCTVFISADTGQTVFGTSYFKFRDKKIIEATEYWAEEYSAPESRQKWTS